MTNADILIVSEQATDYAACLDSLGVDMALAHDADHAGQAYGGQPVVLGEPHLIAEALPALADVRWIQSTWAGITPLLPASRSGITVTGVKDVFGPQMAEFCLGYMLAFELGILDRFASQRDRRWDDRLTGRLAGRTLVVLGTGSIGRAVARAATDLGMVAVGVSRSGAETPPFQAVFPVERLTEALAQADHLVSVLPDTPQTQNLLDRAALACLRPGAVFINVGRGTVVDDAALVAALREQRLGGAVLDVFRDEPLPPSHPFWETPRLLITGHVAAHSHPEDIARLFMDNHRRYVAGEPLLHRVDPDRGY